MTACDRRRALARLADGELPEISARDLRRHLEGCPVCRQAFVLLEAENAALAAALAPARPAPSPALLPRIAAAAAAVVLIVGALFGLLEVYERMVPAPEEELVAAVPRLDTPVLLRAEAVPLSEVLAELSERSGVAVTLSAEAGARLAPEPRVSLTLSNPIMLRSVLALLSEFYGLSATTDDGGVVLH
jgi:anti-sigma factor RsiW